MNKIALLVTIFSLLLLNNSAQAEDCEAFDITVPESYMDCVECGFGSYQNAACINGKFYLLTECRKPDSSNKRCPYDASWICAPYSPVNKNWFRAGTVACVQWGSNDNGPLFNRVACQKNGETKRIEPIPQGTENGVCGKIIRLP
jgi:hypothetical protein